MGSRRGLAKCYHKAEDNEQILYEDFTSLYPTINKYGTYPIGHPTIIVNPESNDTHNYFGLAKVDVIAPEKLLHQVLPVKLNGKLMFPLCKKCVEDQLDRPWFERTNICAHTDKERTMTGTWCTAELQKAVEKGYRILKIHEVWHFHEDQQKEGLFTPYVNTLLKCSKRSPEIVCMLWSRIVFIITSSGQVLSSPLFTDYDVNDYCCHRLV